MRRSLTLLCWLTGLAATVVVLVAAGRGPLAGPDLVRPSSWATWAAGREPVDAAVAIVRSGLLVVAAYLLAVTVLGLLARLAAVPRLLGAIDVAGGPLVRHVLTGALGVGLATSTLTPAIATASTSPPPTAVMRLLDDDPTAASTTSSTAPAAPTTAIGAAPSVEVVSPSTDAEHEVLPGQSFWHIAERHVEVVLRRPPTEREIASYWRDLVAANRDRLVAPSEPDLIYPGQRFRLP